MTKRVYAWVVAGLVLGFAAGWFGAQVRDVDKLSRDKVAVTKWEYGVMLLVHNARDTKLVDPAKVTMVIGGGLDSQSIALAYLYDGMSPALKKNLKLWIPAARVIAMSQQGKGLLGNRMHLLIFANCMRKVRSSGGLLRDCVQRQSDWKVGKDKSRQRH